MGNNQKTRGVSGSLALCRGGTILTYEHKHFNLFNTNNYTVEILSLQTEALGVLNKIYLYSF